MTVVAALFQELGVYCHAIIAMRCISSVCDCYSRNMDINCHCHALACWHSGILAFWHSAFVTVVTTLFQEMDTHCCTRCIAALLHCCIAAFWRLGYSNSKKWASSTTVPCAEFRTEFRTEFPTEFRENSKDCSVLYSRK